MHEASMDTGHFMMRARSAQNIFHSVVEKSHRFFLTAERICRIVTRTTAKMSDLIAYVDGGSHGNPGPSGIGVVIEDASGEKTRIAKWIGHQDNNVAEYVALLEALQHALAQKARALRVYSDSEVVVRQMTGEYDCSSPRLAALNFVCRKLARALEFSITYLPREQNHEANRLAHDAVRLRNHS